MPARLRPALLAASALAAFALCGCHVVARHAIRDTQHYVLRYPVPMEPSTLDPMASDSLWTNELLQNVYEGLTTLDVQSRVAACLADRWDISPDGRTYTFHLNPRATFHNGRRVSAADVKYSLERWCWPDTKSPSAQPVMRFVVGAADVLAGRRRDIAGIRVVDPGTVAITTDRPRAYFLLEISGGSVVCREAIEAGPKGRFTVPMAVGTGPFTLKEYTPGRRAVLESYPPYYRGAPPCRTILRPIVVDLHTAHMKVENGEVDASYINSTEYAQDLQSPKLRPDCLAIPTGNIEYVGMDARLQPVFADARVRRAIALAIDRDALARMAWLGVSPRADSLLPTGVVGSPSPAEVAGRLPYDPRQARALLAAAGHPGGRGIPTLTLVYIQALPAFFTAAQMIRDDLRRNLGISVDLQEREQAAALSDLDHGRLPFFLMGWTAVDPHDFLATLLRSDSQQNTIGYSNPQFDAACDRADAELDTARRAALYRQADDVAMRDLPIIPLVYARQCWLVRPYVHHLQTNLGGLLPHYTTAVGRE